MGLTRKVRWFLFFLIFCFLEQGLFYSYAQLGVEEQKKISLQSRDLILSRKYEEAEALLEKLVQDRPEELLGYFGLMALYQVRNFENFDFRFDPPYKEWDHQGRKLARKVIQDSNSSSWDLLVAGGILEIAGFYRAHNSKWFSALRDGSLGFHTFKRSLEEDPQMIDALFGISLYEYWRSYYTRKLHFLPFFPDRREEGYSKLAQVAKEGLLTSIFAEISLAFIDLKEKRFEEALKTVDQLRVRYPQNVVLRTLRGEILLKLKKYPDAIQEFSTVLTIDPALTKSHLFLGLAYAESNTNDAKAGEFLERYLDVEPDAPPPWRDQAVKKLKKLGKVPRQDRKFRARPLW